MELTGKIVYIKYNANNFASFILKTEQDVSIDKKINVVGSFMGELKEEEQICAEGEFEESAKYGRQFRAKEIRIVLPQSADEILTYLKSGFLPITKKVAERIVEKFGDKTMQILESEPKRLLEVKGILREGEKRKAKNNVYETIIKVFNSKTNNISLLSFCTNVGLTSYQATNVVSEFGIDTIKNIKENPFCLTRIDGISFKTADMVMQKMFEKHLIEETNVGKINSFRVYECIYFVLNNLNDGSTGIPMDYFYQQVSELLGYRDSDEIIKQYLDSVVKDKKAVIDTINGVQCVFSKYYYYTEKVISKSLLEIEGIRKQDINFEEEFKNFEKSNDISLSDEQKEAVKMALTNPVSVITGGAGVGKTTIIKAILFICEDYLINSYMAAPTGRAAKRMQEATGGESKTIHRLLECYFDGEKNTFQRNEDTPLDAGIYIIDESSMIDVRLAYYLTLAIGRHTSFVFIGDVNQLPPVGAGKFLEDIINSKKIPCMKLTHIFRQALSSKIIVNASKINNGEMPLLDNDLTKDFFFVERETNESSVNSIVKMITDNIPNRWHFTKNDIQVLAPMKNSGVGTEHLNNVLQKVLNPNAKKYAEIEILKEKEKKESLFLTKEERKILEEEKDISMIKYGFRTFFVGDKVMQIKNNYDKNVFNGDVGVIVSINKELTKVHFDDITDDVIYSKSELKELTLAYACTIHKSQGSEYPCVIIPMMMTNYAMLSRKILYTAVTRGKKLVIIVGQKQAVGMAACGNQVEKVRFTKLKDFLVES